MSLRRTPILVHLLGAAAASTLLAYWALRLVAPATPVAPASASSTVIREPDAALAARMFGDVNAGPLASAMNVQVSGVFAAGRSSSAVISVDGKPARAVLLGQELSSGVRLTEVRADGVTLEHDGARTQYSVPPLSVAKSSALTTSFRREGATLTAPSLDVPSTIKSTANAPQIQGINGQPALGGPGRNIPPESQMPRHLGPVPSAPSESAPANPNGAG